MREKRPEVLGSGDAAGLNNLVERVYRGLVS